VRPGLLVLLCTACAPAPSSSSEGAPKSVEIAFPGGAPIVRRAASEIERTTTITVLDEGAAPRTLFRYRAEPAKQVAAHVRYQVESAMHPLTEGSAPIPQGSFIIAYDLRVTTKTPEASGGQLLLVDAASVTTEPLDEIGKIVIQAPQYRPDTAPPSLEISSSANGEMARIPPQATSAYAMTNLRGMSVPFPLTPIGVGATWRLVQTYEEPLPLIEEAEWTLVGWDGRRARLRCTQRYTLPNRSIASPAGAFGMRMEITATWSDVVVDLDGPPLIVSGTQVMDMRIPIENVNAVMHTKTHTTVTGR
jgi:hypothetical protein